MGLSIDEAMAAARQGTKINCTLVSNQDDGLVIYADGVLPHQAPSGPPPLQRAERFDSDPPLPFRASIDIINGNPPQLFVFHPDKRVDITVGGGAAENAPVPVTLKFGNAQPMNLRLDRRGKVLVGEGRAVPGLSSPGTNNAVYALSFRVWQPGVR